MKDQIMAYCRGLFSGKDKAFVGNVWWQYQHHLWWSSLKPRDRSHASEYRLYAGKLVSAVSMYEMSNWNPVSALLLESTKLERKRVTRKTKWDNA